MGADGVSRNLAGGDQDAEDILGQGDGRVVQLARYVPLDVNGLSEEIASWLPGDWQMDSLVATIEQF